jgi:hypothetical protein
MAVIDGTLPTFMYLYHNWVSHLTIKCEQYIRQAIFLALKTVPMHYESTLWTACNPT